MKTSSIEQAIVIGGSMAGLLTARVLSDHCQNVMIIERDAVQDQPELRKGQPQTRHLHALLASGFQIISSYFPDLPHAFAELDAFTGDMGRHMRWYSHGGYRLPIDFGQEGTTLTRPQLEYFVRNCVIALPNVVLCDGKVIQKLLTSADHQKVTGVSIEYRPSGETAQLSADLVVDCTGRGSQSPRWLADLGFTPPRTSEVKVDIGYATRYFRREPNDARADQWMFITPDGDQQNCFGAAFAVEGGRWMVSMGGWGGNHCPGEADGYTAFAKQLPAPDLYGIVSEAEPISDVFVYKFPSSLRQHYEQLTRFPSGYLVLGDAIASFNPTYGQGMTSAAMQAVLLDEILQKRPSLQRLPHKFFKQAAKTIDTPWRIAVGEDFRFATTSGPKPFGTDFINRYMTRVSRACQHDPVVGMAFLQVMNLLRPPQHLFHPRIIYRLLKSV